MTEEKVVPNAVKFAIGGIAGMCATVFVQPLDLIKNRMQLAGKKTSTAVIVQNIIKKEGPFALYTGLSAGLMRQATYTTTRMGIYTALLERFSKDGPPSFFLKAALGMLAGAMGSFVGTPAEVALIRMTADGRLPLSERRGYKNVFNAIVRISKEEGLTTLWRGAIPTMGRAMVVNAAQLSSYSQAKQMLLNTGFFQENISLHFAASMISGILTTVASMPVDIAKTRIQNMKTTDGVPEYKGTMDVMLKICKNEGLFSLWKGFLPYYARLGPHTVLVFIFFEQLSNAYKQHFA